MDDLACNLGIVCGHCVAGMSLFAVREGDS